MPTLSRRGSLGDLRSIVRAIFPKSTSTVSTVQIVDEHSDKTSVDMEYADSKAATHLAPIKTDLMYLPGHAHLHNLYESSEEESSPSPVDYASRREEMLGVPFTVEAEDDLVEDEAEDDDEADCDSLSEIDDDLDVDNAEIIVETVAVAIPLIFAGRPRLIDIIRLAPMQKRRAPPAIPAYSARRPSLFPTDATPSVPRHFSRPSRSPSATRDASRGPSREASRPLSRETSDHSVTTAASSVLSLAAPTTAPSDNDDADADHADLLRRASADIRSPRLAKRSWLAATDDDDADDAHSLGPSSDGSVYGDPPPALRFVDPASTPTLACPGSPPERSPWADLRDPDRGRTERGWRGLGMRMLGGVDRGVGRKRRVLQRIDS